MTTIDLDVGMDRNVHNTTYPGKMMPMCKSKHLSNI